MSSLSQHVRVVVRTSQLRCLGTGVTVRFYMEPEKHADDKKIADATIFTTIVAV